MSPFPDTDPNPVLDQPPSFRLTRPYEWYAHGVPMANGSQAGLELLCGITGFRPITPRPAFGQWTGAIVEEFLRRHGPYIFVGNWNSARFHAVVVVGRTVRSETTGQIDEIVYIDPAMGLLQVSIEHFNRSMTSIGVSPYNPIYYPAPSAVRATDVDTR